MLLHQCKLIIIEFGGLIKYLVGDIGFSQVMKKSRNTYLAELFFIKSECPADNQTHGCDIDTVLECIFVADLDKIDINRNGMIILDSLDQFTCNVIGRLEKILRLHIIIQILNTFPYPLYDLRAEHNLTLILYTALFHKVSCIGGKLGLKRMNLFGIRFTLRNIDTTNLFLEILYLEIIKIGSLRDKLTACFIQNSLVDLHSRL